MVLKIGLEDLSGYECPAAADFNCSTFDTSIKIINVVEKKVYFAYLVHLYEFTIFRL